MLDGGLAHDGDNQNEAIHSQKDGQIDFKEFLTMMTKLDPA